MGKHQKLKTHCPQGHPYDDENTFIDSRGSRGCRICRRDRRRISSANLKNDPEWREAKNARARARYAQSHPKVGRHVTKSLVTDEGRVCTRCEEFKEWVWFDKRRRGTHGHSSFCKDCRNATRRKGGPRVVYLVTDDGRVCTKCGEFKEWSRFSKGKGPRGFASECKDCHSIRKIPLLLVTDEGRECAKCGEFKNWSQFNKHRKGCTNLEKQEVTRFLHTFKQVPCADCGIQYEPHLMDFDHLSDKEFTIGRGGGGRSKEKLLKEIAKCEVVCCICHRVRTWNRVHPDNPITRNPIFTNINQVPLIA